MTQGTRGWAPLHLMVLGVATVVGLVLVVYGPSTLHELTGPPASPSSQSPGLPEAKSGGISTPKRQHEEGNKETDGQTPAGSVLFIKNVHVWTGDDDDETPTSSSGIDALGTQKVDSILVVDEIIQAVGAESSHEMQAQLRVQRASGRHFRVLDGGNRMLVAPGFIDSHVHLLIAGCGLASVRLRDVDSKDLFVERVAKHALTRPAGSWIREGDWDHEKWGGELPTHEWIDAVTPNHFVFVCRLDGHMCLANKRALEAANITKDTPEVRGGTITRNPVTGEPTGVLKDNAMELMWAVIPKQSPEEEDACLEAAMDNVLRHGVTSVHHMSYTWDDIAVFKRAKENNKLRIRIYAAVPLSTWQQLADEKQRLGVPLENRTWGDDWLRMGNLKAFVDGSLGSHTAYMFEPFTDTPDRDTSLMLVTEEELEEWTQGADQAGLHLSVHAIGDKANYVLLNAYEKLISVNGKTDRRMRIEHAQHLREAEQLRMNQLGVIASMQPYHVSDDGRWAERVLGSVRSQQAWPFRSLLDKNVTIAFGSDWFVAPPEPMLGIGAAVTRLTLQQIEDLGILNSTQSKTSALVDGWIPEQKVSVREALRAYTVNGAYASFEEHKKGRIKAGMLADLVLLDRDITALSGYSIREVAAKLWNTQVEATIVGGRVLYSRLP